MIEHNGDTLMPNDSSRRFIAYMKGVRAARKTNKPTNPYTHKASQQQWENGYHDRKQELLSEEFDDG